MAEIRRCVSQVATLTRRRTTPVNRVGKANPIPARYKSESAVASWYAGSGHMPFIEDAERFNHELAAFVDRANE